MPPKKGQAAAKGGGGGGGKKGGAKEDTAGGSGYVHIKVRHILTEKQSKCLEALAAIQAGRKFDDVAREFSEDKARTGGDLGWKTRQDLNGVFADAAFNLAVGQMTSQPVKTSFGYHLILCEGKK